MRGYIPIYHQRTQAQTSSKQVEKSYSSKFERMLGALVRPNALYLSCGATNIWWFPDLRSNLEKYFALNNSSNNSSTVGNGKQSLIVTTFKAL